MPKEKSIDFVQGYNYARRIYGKLMGNFSADEILEFAGILSEDDGENAELARGMAAYCEEMAKRRAVLRGR